MTKANFRSDNNTGVCPEILDALIEEAHRKDDSYGRDSQSSQLKKAFSELFEREVEVIPVASGTAANALALRMITPSYGMVLCSDIAHIDAHEAGAPQFFNAGSKLVPLTSSYGKLTHATVESYLAGRDWNSVNCSPPTGISLTQATEVGTTYATSEISNLCDLARTYKLSVHMDGARFANAVTASNKSPANLTWRQGIDVLCFGATKNGAMCAEAIILFRAEPSPKHKLLSKQSGHLLSKMRFLSVQLLAMIRDDLWLKNANAANAMATRLESRLRDCSRVRIEYPVQANEVFFSAPTRAVEKLKRAGHGFHVWSGDDERSVVRAVTSYDTSDADIDAFVSSLSGSSGSVREN